MDKVSVLSMEQTTVAGFPEVTYGIVAEQIQNVEFWKPSGTRTIVCCITTKNGQAFVGQAHCQPAVPYSTALGEQYAKEDAFKQLFAAEVYKMRHLAMMAHQYIAA